LLPLERGTIAAEIVFPIEEGAVWHHAITADVAHFIAFGGIHCDDAEYQALIAAQLFHLFRNPILDKIKNPGLAEIFGKMPAVSLPSQVAPAAIAEYDMNRVQIAHVGSIYPQFLIRASPIIIV
jgi:hypothetical protein